MSTQRDTTASIKTWKLKNIKDDTTVQQNKSQPPLGVWVKS